MNNLIQTVHGVGYKGVDELFEESGIKFKLITFTASLLISCYTIFKCFCT